jgi:hypothetical protein
LDRRCSDLRLRGPDSGHGAGWPPPQEEQLLPADLLQHLQHVQHWLRQWLQLVWRLWWRHGGCSDDDDDAPTASRNQVSDDDEENPG